MQEQSIEAIYLLQLSSGIANTGPRTSRRRVYSQYLICSVSISISTSFTGLFHLMRRIKLSLCHWQRLGRQWRCVPSSYSSSSSTGIGR